MTPGLLWLLIVWGALTVVLIILLIYRSTLTMQEDDQLFLDDSASAIGGQKNPVRVSRGIFLVHSSPLSIASLTIVSDSLERSF